MFPIKERKIKAVEDTPFGKLAFGGKSEKDNCFVVNVSLERFIENHGFSDRDIHNMEVIGYASPNPNGRCEIVDEQGNSYNPSNENGTLYFSHQYYAHNLAKAIAEKFPERTFRIREYAAQDSFKGTRAEKEKTTPPPKSILILNHSKF